MLSRLTFALLISGFVLLNSFGRWAAQPAPAPRTSSAVATRLVRTGSEVGPARGRLARYHASFPCYGQRVTGAVARLLLKNSSRKSPAAASLNGLFSSHVS